MPSSTNSTLSPFRHVFLASFPRAHAEALSSLGETLWEALAFVQQPPGEPTARREMTFVLTDLLVAARQLCEFGEFLDDTSSSEDVLLLSMAVECAGQVVAAIEPLRAALAPMVGEVVGEEIDHAHHTIRALIADLEASSQTLSPEDRGEKNLRDQVALIVQQRLLPALRELAATNPSELPSERASREPGHHGG